MNHIRAVIINVQTVGSGGPDAAKLTARIPDEKGALSWKQGATPGHYRADETL